MNALLFIVDCAYYDLFSIYFLLDICILKAKYASHYASLLITKTGSFIWLYRYQVIDKNEI